MQKVITSLKIINYKLFFTLLFFGFLPTFYTTVRVYFLGTLPLDWGFNIASQLSWVNLIYEVLYEAIMLPIFFMIGKSLHDRQKLGHKIFTSLVTMFLLYTLLSLFLCVYAKPLLEFMAQKKSLIEASIVYIRLESMASIFSTLVQFLFLVFISLNKKKIILFSLILQTLCSVLLDTFLVSSLPISANIGVNGIAITNIIVNFILFFTLLYFLKKQGIKVFSSKKLSLSWIKEWAKVGGYSGLESLIRNLAFMLMIIRMINIVGEQGTFWVTNTFIWSWLLLPILQLGQLIKRDCGKFGNKAIKENALGYFALTGIIVSFWLISIPFWKPFLLHVLNIQNYELVYKLTLISLIFYIIFAFNNVCDSIFYGIGKTQYMLIQSIVINISFYGTLYILYTKNIFHPTLINIVIMFGTGILLDSILTGAIYVWMLRKRGIYGR